MFNISPKTQANFGQKDHKRGALNPNSVLCTDQAPSPAFSGLNSGSALNPRTLNPGTTVPGLGRVLGPFPQHVGQIDFLMNGVR